VATVYQLVQGLPVARPCGWYWIRVRIGGAYSDGPDRRPLRWNAVRRAEARHDLRHDAEKYGTEPFIDGGEQGEQGPQARETNSPG
jgi:hypothetical protein